jgi:DNA repair exonuclease SbcCD ATPase subunit
MMKRRRTLVALFAVIALSLVACEKTEKGESKRWEQGLTELTELSATYPGFRGAIDLVRSKAESAMETARGISDKEQRIEAMAIANRSLSSGFIGQLRGVDKQIKKLREQVLSLTGDAETDDEKRVLDEAKKQADATFASVDSLLKAGARTPAEASAILEKIDSDLDFAGKALKQVRDRIGARKRAETAAVEAKAAADKAAQEAVAPWTCGYCDHENPHDARKCSNCSADRPSQPAGKER